MITIEEFKQIDKALIKIDQEATKAIKNGRKFTIEYRDDGITKKQFNAMHKWFEMCAEHLNSIGEYRHAPVTGKKIPWTKEAFKDAYKLILFAAFEKKSTKDQNTVEPNEIVQIVTAHLATAWQDKTITLPEWPSNRG